MSEGHKEIFTNIYRTNFWRGKDSVSGPGSDLVPTAFLRDVLPLFLRELQPKTLLDIPCGDYFWQSYTKWPADMQIIGADIVPEIINELRHKYHGTRWELLDATKDSLPAVDVILARDLLVHFSDEDIRRTLKNFRASGSKWLLATTFPGARWQNIETGEWHTMDLAQFRYGLGEPEGIMPEHSSEDFSNKSLGLWRLNK